jgi:radical SAM superfamily enzyme YgiQ (UPF0313 family)
MRHVVLIHPPIAKPGEPPAGIARLKGALDSHNVKCSLLDANLEGTHFVFAQNIESDNAWTSQAAKNVDRHLKEIWQGSAFKTIDHYNRIVRDLDRILNVWGIPFGYNLSLGDCTHKTLAPTKSDDLLFCAENPQTNPFYKYYVQKLVPELERRAPDIIGLSINFLSQAFCSFALIGVLKKAFPGIKIVIGGGLITSWKRNSNWQNPFSGLVDECVDGPGESWFLAKINMQKKISFATPDYNDLKTYDYYSPGFVLPYNTTCGCYWRKCSFCPEKAEDNPFKQIAHQQVLKDVMELTENTKPSLLHFLDNAITPALLKKFIVTPPGAPWYGYVRFTEHLTDLDFCRQLKKSGCVMLKLGLESGDQDVLDRMNKGINLQTVTYILNNLKTAGIPTFVYLLFGTPYESEIQAKNTMEFVLKHHDKISYINPAIFNMPIESTDTLLYNIRSFSKGDLSLYVKFDHPTGWDRQKVRHFLDREFSRQPAIAKILRRTPKIFTSNHAPFFDL